MSDEANHVACGSELVEYKKYGFQEIPGGVDSGRRKMFLDLAVVRKAQEAGMETLFTVKAS